MEHGYNDKSPVSNDVARLNGQVPAGRNTPDSASLASAVLAHLGLGKSPLPPDSETSVEQLITALDDPRWNVREAAVQALGRLGEQAPIERLVAALHDPSWRVRSEAALVLGNMGPRAPIETLVVILSDEDESVRAAAAQALGNMGQRIPVDALLAALDDSEWLVREAAVIALGKLGQRAPIVPLLTALTDEEEMVREAAKLALEQTHPEALPTKPASTPTPPASTLAKGPRRLGPYELHERLGEVTWKAIDTRVQRAVVMKLLPAHLPDNADFLTDLEREVRGIAALRHSNIAPVLDFQIVGTSTPYLVRQYIEGETLSSYIRSTSRQGKFPTATDIVYLFTCIGLAIDYAHQRGIVHGNIKPSNILLALNTTVIQRFGEPLLCDFRLAQLPGQSYSSNFRPLYLAPEQLAGKPENYRTDIYALGVILYEICTGVRPFQGDSPVEVTRQQLNALVTPPEQINPQISPALSEVIRHSLAKDPVARFPNGLAMAMALAGALDIPLPRQG